MNEKEILNEIHMEIHALRRIPNYKANPSEVKISKLIIEYFKKDCRECREREELLNKDQKKIGFFDKLLGGN